MSDAPKNARYEVTIMSGPPGHADSDKRKFATLKEARKWEREQSEGDWHFRWSKIVDLMTDKQID